MEVLIRERRWQGLTQRSPRLGTGIREEVAVFRMCLRMESEVERKWQMIQAHTASELVPCFRVEECGKLEPELWGSWEMMETRAGLQVLLGGRVGA